jgi:hypothetical protein
LRPAWTDDEQWHDGRFNLTNERRLFQDWARFDTWSSGGNVGARGDETERGYGTERVGGKEEMRRR